MMNLRVGVCAMLFSVVFAGNSVYDLTYDLTNGAMPMLTNSSFLMVNVTSTAPPLRMENITMSSAVGTHVQAPCRYTTSQWCITNIPLPNLIAPVVVLTISPKNPDTAIMMSDLQAWENKHSVIGAGSIVLIKTNWGVNWSNASRYFGTNDTLNSTNLHYPGLAKDAGDYLANKSIVGLGIDTPAVDYGQSNFSYPVQTSLASKNIYTILNLNLTSVDGKNTKNSTAYVMPMKIPGAGAAPCRILITQNAAFSLLSRPTLLLLGICLTVMSYLRH